MNIRSIGGGAKRKNLFLWGLISVISIAIIIAALMLLLNLFSKETYYVLKEDTPTRTQVTAEMLEAVPALEGTAPPAALGLSEVQSGSVITKSALLGGEILTLSNTGGREDISVGVPDEWVITSFGVNADNAVGGRIQRGYYFDMLITTDSGAFYPFVNVLALDTTVSLNNASNADAAETAEAKEGMTSQYVVGMPPSDAAKMQQLVSEYGANIQLVLSPRQNEYAKPRLDDYKGMFKFEVGSDPVNMGEGTDYSFTVVKRDEFGRPIEEIADCSDGNSVITGDVCKDKESTKNEGAGETTEKEILILRDKATKEEITVPVGEMTEVDQTKYEIIDQVPESEYEKAQEKE